MDKQAARRTVAETLPGEQSGESRLRLAAKQTQNNRVCTKHTFLWILNSWKLLQEDAKVYMCFCKMQCIWVWRLLCQHFKKENQISALEGWINFVWETAHRWPTCKFTPRLSWLVLLGLANWLDFMREGGSQAGQNKYCGSTTWYTRWNVQILCSHLVYVSIRWRANRKQRGRQNIWKVIGRM